MKSYIVHNGLHGDSVFMSVDTLINTLLRLWLRNHIVFQSPFCWCLVRITTTIYILGYSPYTCPCILGSSCPPLRFWILVCKAGYVYYTHVLNDYYTGPCYLCLLAKKLHPQVLRCPLLHLVLDLPLLPLHQPSQMNT